MEAHAAAADAAALRPLSIGEILDVGIKIYWRNALTLFALVLAIVAPVQVVSALVQSSAAPDFRPFSPDFDFDPAEQEPVTAHDAWVYGLGSVVVAILAVVANGLATGACFKAVVDAYLEEKAGWKDSLRFAARRVHSVIWVTFVSTLIAGLGLIFCIAPGVWLYVSWAVAVPVLLTEGLKGTKAMGRSRELVQGRWWSSFGVVALAYLLASIVNGVISGAIVAVTFSDPSTTAGLVASVVLGTLASMLTTPFTAAVVAVLYIDLRVRKEGFDVQLLAERLGLAPKPGGYRPAPALVPRRPSPASASEPPPFWPPPPGWQPGPAPDAPAPAGASPAAPDTPASAAPPPFWPPPPGWDETGGSTQPAQPPPAESDSESEQPPYWPPPPDWRPPSQ